MCALDLDTYFDSQTVSLAALPAAFEGKGTGSSTAFIQDDRLSFCENLTVSRTDVSYSLPRGALPANGVSSSWPMESRLAVHLTKTKGSIFSGVNSPKSVNRDPSVPYPGGAEPFTFLTRLGGSTATGNMSPGAPYVSYNVGVGPINRAHFKVMSWEGAANTPLAAPTSGLVLSTAPSSHFNGTDIISMGSGDCYDSQLLAADPGTLEGPRDWLQNCADHQGDTANILPGDSLVVQGENTAGFGCGFLDGGIKAGTYLARHAVDNTAATDDNGNPVARCNTSTMGGSDGALDLTFPKPLTP